MASFSTSLICYRVTHPRTHMRVHAHLHSHSHTHTHCDSQKLKVFAKAGTDSRLPRHPPAVPSMISKKLVLYAECREATLSPSEVAWTGGRVHSRSVLGWLPEARGRAVARQRTLVPDAATGTAFSSGFPCRLSQLLFFLLYFLLLSFF